MENILINHPNPNFARENIVMLNGTWQLSIEGKTYNIKVPYSPESELSGIAYKKFIAECTYAKIFNFDRNSLGDQRLFLHFGAVDYIALVYVNGNFAGWHRGGYTPFSMDITDFIVDGENKLEVEVKDFLCKSIASGKQTFKDYSYGCFYTRTTGIWQSVWLEKKPQNHIESVCFYPDINAVCVDAEILTGGIGDVNIEVFFDGESVGKGSLYCEHKCTINIKLSKKHLWELGNGALYYVVIDYGGDKVYSYFGLRQIRFEGNKFMLNGKSVFQRLVLDQGYYGNGVYTPEKVTNFEDDIERALAVGFNGARLHQKVFDPLYLYYADKKGFMVWGEFASWGIDYTDFRSLGDFLQEWQESIKRDFNHPCIVCWCPLNEVWYANILKTDKLPNVGFVDMVYDFTKKLDKTRPVLDVSGGYHGKQTDFYDFHCYENAKTLKEYIDALDEKDELEVKLLFKGQTGRRYKKGEPVMISEFGGMTFAPELSSGSSEGSAEGQSAWGYGKGADGQADFIARYAELIDVIIASPNISGFCYTQLYDVEQEQNGLYFYDRRCKLDRSGIEEIYKINTKKAKIEE